MTNTELQEMFVNAGPDHTENCLNEYSGQIGYRNAGDLWAEFNKLVAARYARMEAENEAEMAETGWQPDDYDPLDDFNYVGSRHHY